MENTMNLLVAYSNKIALGFSMKEHALNEAMLEQEGRTIYSLNISGQPETFRKYTDLYHSYNSREEASLCNQALNIVEIGLSINALLRKREKLVLENAFSRGFTMVKQEEDQPAIVGTSFQALHGVDYDLDWDKQKIKKFVLANYKRTPQEIKALMKSLNLPNSLIKNWIQHSQKSERIANLRDEVIKLARNSVVTLADFKKMARKVYKTRLFRATDNWCLNYLRKFKLEGFVQVPEGFDWK